MIHRLILVGAFTGFAFSTAQAADVEAIPPIYDWSGFYAGAQLGYGWGDFEAPIEQAGDEVERFDGDIEGILGGLHVGYNAQVSQFVFGLEADVEASDVDGDADLTLGIDFLTTEIQVLGSIRARAGFAFDNLLFYATGGLAGAEIKYTTDISLTGSSDDTVDHWGYTVGAGIEYAVTESISLRAEYRYTDLGKEDFEASSIVCIPACTIEGDVDFHAVRGGISWHFGAI